MNTPPKQLIKLNFSRPPILKSHYDLKKIRNEEINEYLNKYFPNEIFYIVKLCNELNDYFDKWVLIKIKQLIDSYYKVMKCKEMYYFRRQELYRNRHEFQRANADYFSVSNTNLPNLQERLNVFKDQENHIIEKLKEYDELQYLFSLQLYSFYFLKLLKVCIFAGKHCFNAREMEFKHILLKFSQKLNIQMPFFDYSNWNIRTIENHPLLIFVQDILLKSNEVQYPFDVHLDEILKKVYNEMESQQNLLQINFFLFFLKFAKRDLTMDLAQSAVYRNPDLCRVIFSFLLPETLVMMLVPLKDKNKTNLKII